MLLAETEAARTLSDNLQIIGIDLAGMFGKLPSELKFLTLLETPIEDFQPSQKFDLITSVHGLHYISDKLSVIQKAARLLKPYGVFLANLELRNMKLLNRENSNRVFSSFLRKQGFTFNGRKHLLPLKGGRNFDLPFAYLGADDRAGPNSTGQVAVDSYYGF